MSSERLVHRTAFNSSNRPGCAVLSSPFLPQGLPKAASTQETKQQYIFLPSSEHRQQPANFRSNSVQRHCPSKTFKSTFLPGFCFVMIQQVNTSLQTLGEFKYIFQNVVAFLWFIDLNIFCWFSSWFVLLINYSPFLCDFDCILIDWLEACDLNSLKSLQSRIRLIK